jgi:hypothetical protein
MNSGLVAVGLVEGMGYRMAGANLHQSDGAGKFVTGHRSQTGPTRAL